ncbi:MAG: MCP four helix bundle domain-containing protein, partial [Polyangiales bacterium]
MKDDARLSLRLFVAFAAVILAFASSTALVNLRTLAIERQTELLLENAMPSIEHLHHAEQAIHAMEADVDAYIDLPSDQRVRGRQRIAEHWHAVDDNIERYHRLPMFPGEEDLFAEIPAALRAFDETTRALLAEVDAGDLPLARLSADRSVSESASKVTERLERVSELNLTHAVAAAKQIDKTRHQGVVASIVFDAIAASLTIFLAVWIARRFRAHDRLQLEHQRLVEQRAAELELFGVRVAHDLLSPLSSLTYCLSAFNKVSEHDEKLAHAAERARQCVHRARQLVDGVFDFARSGGAPNLDARASVAEAIELVVEELGEAAPKDRVELEVGPIPACSVRCTRGVLASVLTNLVHNSIKFMSDSVVRKVAIRVEERKFDVRFEIEDTGPGISQELAPSIFEPYVRGDGVTQPGL